MVVLPQAGPSADASVYASPIYRCHTGLAQRCAGPISIFATPRFRAAAGQNPCGTFIESRTGSQAMATLQYRMFGLAALGWEMLTRSRPVAQTLRCAFKRS